MAEKEDTMIPLSVETRDALKQAILQVQARLHREMTYDDFLLWALQELGLARIKKKEE